MSNPKRRLLIVDDEPDILLILGKRLEVSGFEVFTAVDGDDALEKAKEMPDLIILDLMLPKRSGLDVCSTLRKDHQYDKIPIVLFTGKGDEEVIARLGQDQTRLKQWGADAYVQKTEGAPVLLARINELLAKPRKTS